MDLLQKTLGWAYKKGIKDIRGKIEKIIKKKRLIFLGDNHLLYINKEGKRNEYNFGQAASKFIVEGGWADQMVELGITINDIVNILVEEYAKHKKEAK
ncbi:MAG: hypothetical protein PHQ86_06545 [Dehalococcoidales bacterium]|nr:hypothetical protein [Dehalococcoidales bacterium]